MTELLHILKFMQNFVFDTKTICVCVMFICVYVYKMEIFWIHMD